MQSLIHAGIKVVYGRIDTRSHEVSKSWDWSVKCPIALKFDIASNFDVIAQMKRVIDIIYTTPQCLIPTYKSNKANQNSHAFPPSVLNFIWLFVFVRLSTQKVNMLCLLATSMTKRYVYGTSGRKRQSTVARSTARSDTGISNYIHANRWLIITHQFPNFHNGLAWS